MTIAVSVSFPDIYSTLSGLVALVVAFGGLQLLAHLARDRGKGLEGVLFDDWGGIPSVCIFRHCDSLIPKPAKLRYHALLAGQTGIQAPSAETEKNEPHIADEIYRSWAAYLRAQTRDEKKYSLLFKENINYGFRRNMLGIKWHCVVSGLIGNGIIIFPKLPVLNFTQIELAIIALISVYILVVTFVINSKWVKPIAVEYAKRLIETANA